MSFSGDCVRFGERLAKLVDAGVSVKEAAVSLGISPGRCYAILRATGRPAGSARRDGRDVDAVQLATVFTSTSSINQAAKACGVSHGLARRLLVAQGLVLAVRQPVGKAQAKRRFFELLAAGWSTSRAARQVGVHERTGRDWRIGARKIGNTRILADGTVIDYTAGTRYTQPVKTENIHRAAAGVRAISSRYLGLADRLAIADGLRAGQTLTVIAAEIGKHTSTVSREIRARSVGGLYLPYRAHTVAAVARARPKPSKLVTNHNLRQAVHNGLRQRLSPETDLASPGQRFPG